MSEGRAKIRQSYSPRYDTNNKNHKHSDPLIKSFREDVPKPPFPRDEDRIVASTATGHLFPPSFRVILSGHGRYGYIGTLSLSPSFSHSRVSPCENVHRGFTSSSLRLPVSNSTVTILLALILLISLLYPFPLSPFPGMPRHRPSTSADFIKRGMNRSRIDFILEKRGKRINKRSFPPRGG